MSLLHCYVVTFICGNLIIYPLFVTTNDCHHRPSCKGDADFHTAEATSNVQARIGLSDSVFFLGLFENATQCLCADAPSLRASSFGVAQLKCD